MAEQPFYAALLDYNALPNFSNAAHTKFEQLLIASITGALQNTVVDITDKRTVLIISTQRETLACSKRRRWICIKKAYCASFIRQGSGRTFQLR
jgi:hypothetical protein